MDETSGYTSCAQGSLDLLALLQLPQVALSINTATKSECLLYGCERTQCLRRSTACPPTGAPPVYTCVPSEYIVDVQPVPMAMCVAMVLSSLVMFCTRRPYDLSNARLAGVLVMAFGLYHLAADVSIYRSCPWSDVTYSQCAGKPGGVGPASQVVAVDACFFNDAWGLSPLATNAQRSPALFSECQLYGCTAAQCLKTTASCTGVTSTQHECVAQEASTDARPTVVVAEALIVAIGVALFVATYRYAGHSGALLVPAALMSAASQVLNGLDARHRPGAARLGAPQRCRSHGLCEEL